MATAQDVYDRSLVLIDETEGSADYADKAPVLIDILQREIAKKEGVTVVSEISALSDTLVISDDSALRIMPYGLAAKFALADKDADMYNEYQSQYLSSLRTIVVTPAADDTDTLNVLSGLVNTAGTVGV